MKSITAALILMLSVLAAAQTGPAAAPSALTPREVAALVQECGARTTRMALRVYNYTYTESAIEYEVGGRGQARRERSKVYEVYPVRGRNWVRVQLSEDGVPFSADKVARERERATKKLVEAEEATQASASPAATGTQPTVRRFTSFGIAVEQHKHGGLSKTYWLIRPTDFFTSHEFYAPRRVILSGREAILLSFRPRPDYTYDRTNVPFKEGIEDYARVMAQLGGRVWLDAADRVIARLEAVPMREVGGAGVASTDAPDASAPLGFELTRLPDGVWVPSLSWYDSYGREDFFWETSTSRAYRYSNFKRFDASVEGVKLETPQERP